MAAKLIRLTYKIAIQLHLVAETRSVCSSRSRWPVRILLDTPSYVTDWQQCVLTVSIRALKDGPDLRISISALP
jgi:hypothetical protein